jgi:hypothetical protein
MCPRRQRPAEHGAAPLNDDDQLFIERRASSQIAAIELRQRAALGRWRRLTTRLIRLRRWRRFWWALGQYLQNYTRLR